MTDHKHRMKRLSQAKGYERDAVVYQCKDCPHVETRFQRGTRVPRLGMRRRRKKK